METPHRRSQGRRSHKNPFANQRGKENFPNLEMFFGTKDVDQSCYSQEGSAILNLSIGARADLNDHLRHVEKYGIDGERQQQTEMGKPSSHQKNSLDAQWDRLLDSSHVDISGSFAAGSSHPRLDLLADSPGIDKSMDVMTDVSHDFFNSSRVKMLSTPEKNLDRPFMVMSRAEMQEECLFEEESDFEPTSGHAAPELKMRIGSEHFTGKDSTFHSFGDADLSRISNFDPEQPGLPLDEEVELSRISNVGSELRGLSVDFLHEKRLEIDEGAFSPIMKDIASPSMVHNSSFSSTPQRSPQSFDIGLEFKMPTKLSSNVKSGLIRPRQRSRRECHPFVSDISRDREQEVGNASSFCDNAPPPISRARNIGCEASGMPAVDSMPADFLRAMGSVKVDGLSPISQTGSQVGASILNRSRQRESDKSSSSSGSFSGRKRYRTVVPRRVYMDSPSQFPDEYDSFSRPSTSLGSSQDSIQRSLLDSFDAVVHPSYNF